MSQVFSEETHRNMLSRIPHCTGREVSDWLRTVDEGPALVRFEEKVSWLRSEHDLVVRPRQGDHPRVRPEAGRAQAAAEPRTEPDHTRKGPAGEMPAGRPVRHCRCGAPVQSSPLRIETSRSISM